MPPAQTEQETATILKPSTDATTMQQGIEAVVHQQGYADHTVVPAFGQSPVPDLKTVLKMPEHQISSPATEILVKAEDLVDQPGEEKTFKDVVIGSPVRTTASRTGLKTFLEKLQKRMPHGAGRIEAN